MNGLRYAWAIAVLSLCGIVATPAWAEVITTGDIYDDGSSFYAGYNANQNGTLEIDSGSVLGRWVGFLGYNSGSTGTAMITGTGSIWANSGYLDVGYSGNGSLKVEAGGIVSSSGSYLGYNSASTGEAIVTGAGSKWTNTYDLHIGNLGSGTLRVEAGGQVSSSGGFLGNNAGSSGTAVISGAGSKWTTTYDLYVGRRGSGTLTVSNGGVVSARTLYASLSDLCGDGTITTNGAVLDGDLIFDATHSEAQTVAFGTGGTLQFPVDGAGSLGIGYNQSGSLRIAEGRSVTSTTGYLGYNAGSTGSAIITGTGSKWTNSGNLYVGYKGSGTLTVSDGGLVSAKALYGSLSDLHGDGTIAVQSGGIVDADLVFDSIHNLTQTLAFGTGGTLQFTVDGKSDLGIGYKHSGSLRIAEGRSIASTNGYLGRYSGSTGTATITGAGSKWTNSSYLYVGDSGSGALRVEAGGQVSDSYGFLGSSSGSTGTAIITGAGSTWTNSGSLYVGSYGSGTLIVSDGGVVSAQTLYASLSDLYGDGTITVHGVVLDADLVFDAGHALTQTLAFGSGGNLQLTVDGKGALGVGYKQSGSLRIAGGRSVASTSGYLGYNPDSTGEVLVTGVGSKWTNSGSLHVGGYGGTGSLRVEDGAWVSNTDGYVARSPGRLCTAIITGAESKWTNSGNLFVGESGSGSLRVEAGGQVSSSGGFLGYNAGSSGTAVISGAGSKWTTTYDLYVRSGSLQVEAGGQISDAGAVLGSTPGCTGTAVITGAGSKWINSGTSLRRLFRQRRP